MDSQRVEELNTPLLVCEPVLAESMHLLARFARAQKALFRLLDNGALKSDCQDGPRLVAAKRMRKFATILSDMSNHLPAMDQYERRALSRRKFAVRAFDAARQAASARE